MYGAVVTDTPTDRIHEPISRSIVDSLVVDRFILVPKSMGVRSVASGWSRRAS